MIDTVFVYGTLQQGNEVRGLHLLDGAEFLGNTRTLDPLYDMYCLGSYPSVQPGGSSYVEGEIWKVNSEIMDLLDEIEGYPHLYSRQIIETNDGPAWIYYMRDAYKISRKQILPDISNTLKWRKDYETC